MSEYVGSRHHTIMVDTPALLESLLAPLYAHDYPTAGQMTSSLYLLFQAMKREATVALSGESADEVFGGYPWFHGDAALRIQSFPWLSLVNGQGESGLSWLSTDIMEKARPFAFIDRQYRQAIAEVPRLEGEETLAAKRRELFYLNLAYFLPFLLDRKDRMSMATGFEVRVPFCDYRLVQYVWNIPWEMKNVDGVEKGILRRAFTHVLPDDVRDRRKSAYPTVQNPAHDRATRDWTLEILNDANAPIQPLLDTRVVRALAESDAPLPPNLVVSPFERIIQINEWLEKYKVTLSL